MLSPVLVYPALDIQRTKLPETNSAKSGNKQVIDRATVRTSRRWTPALLVAGEPLVQEASECGGRCWNARPITDLCGDPFDPSQQTRMGGGVYMLDGPLPAKIPPHADPPVPTAILAL